MNQRKTVSLSFITFLFVFFISIANVQAKNDKKYTSKRLFGENRYETSINIAEQVKNSKFQNIIIANGTDFSDALSGSVLAKKLSAPILLVDSDIKNNSLIIDYIKDNLEKNGSIYILGGTNVISENFDFTFKNLGLNNIHRLGGKDRFETNKLIYDELDKSKNLPIIIVNGFNYPDVMSISSIAAYNEYPILLSDNNSLCSSTRSLIENIKPNKIFIIGGYSSLSFNIKSEVQSIIPKIKEEDIITIGGSNRYETSLNICKYFNPKGKSVMITSGDNFSDALCGSVLAAKLGSPMILIDDKNVDILKEYLDNSSYEEEIILGGAESISKDLEQKLKGEAYNDQKIIIATPNEEQTTTLSNNNQEIIKTSISNESPNSTSIVNILNLTNSDYVVTQGDGYCSAPYDKATALMSDGSYKDFPINWFPSNPNKTSKRKTGTYTFVASIDGFKENYVITIVIKPLTKHTVQTVCSATQGENIFYFLDNALYMSNPKETIPLTSGNITKIVPYRNWVYYLDDKQLFRIKWNGTDKSKIINEDIQDFDISENSLLYSTNNSILSADLNGENIKHLLNTVQTTDNIYYVNHNNYDNEKQIKSNLSSEDLVIDYYDLASCIYKVNINSKSLQSDTLSKINDDFVHNIINPNNGNYYISNYTDYDKKNQVNIKTNLNKNYIFHIFTLYYRINTINNTKIPEKIVSYLDKNYLVSFSMEMNINKIAIKNSG